MINEQSQLHQKEWSHTKSKGFSSVEVLLAAALFGLIVTVFISSYLYGQESTLLSGNRVRAIIIAQEGIEATRNIRDNAFANLIDGTHGIATTSGSWAFSGSSDVFDIFTRTISIGTLDASRKYATSTVTWQQNLQRAGSVSIVTLLSNWREVVETIGDWSNPSQESSLNLPGNNNGLKIQVVGNYAYIVRSGGSTDFVIVDVSDTSNPSLVSSLDLSGTPSNIFVSGSYAYVTSNSNSQELHIINIIDPTLPVVVETYNDSGNHNATGVFVAGSYAYIVFDGGDELVSVDVSNPLSSSFKDGISLDGDAEDIWVIGDYAYIASSDNNEELQVIDISDPSNLSQVAALNLSGNNDGISIAGFDTTIILGRNGGEIHVIDVSTPTSPSDSGSADVGQDVNDIALGNNNEYVFIGDNENGSEFKIIDISNPASIVEIGSVDAGGDINGTAYDAVTDRAFGVGDNNSNELIIFEPQ